MALGLWCISVYEYVVYGIKLKNYFMQAPTPLRSRFGLDGTGFAQLYPNVGGSTIAEDAEFDRIAGVFVSQGAANGVVTIDRLAVDRHDQVAAD